MVSLHRFVFVSEPLALLFQPILKSSSLDPSVGSAALPSVSAVMDQFNTGAADLRTVQLFPQDPSRNHRAYRLTFAKLEPPIIPFMPLMIKGHLSI